MKTTYERGERMRNYSWKNKIVNDYNTNLKFDLTKFFDSRAGMDILDEIHVAYLDIKLEERNRALFQKYSNEITQKDIDFILFKSWQRP